MSECGEQIIFLKHRQTDKEITYLPVVDELCVYLNKAFHITEQYTIVFKPNEIA